MPLYRHVRCDMGTVAVDNIWGTWYDINIKYTERGLLICVTILINYNHRIHENYDIAQIGHS